ncbi:chorismate synthase [Leptotrichia sp. oral taxon 218]|uniref:chorismate synthase n=1 Tax=Leptotrichia sp. oral taxon 218 TaxID=712361 RepID=UPI001B8D1B2C|nr:chorismate synthase [Leptotrichia sp. oral taxon 218]QUB95073.1 chorismate synthase [Leptotrichia sp. oral taxon 218]
MGANFGKNYRISLFGESHGTALGVNIDGVPAGTELDLEFISQEMKRRAPGRSKLTTPRVEKDEFEILSGFFDGRTTGTPLAMIVRNRDQRSKDYSELRRKPRPGHADWSGFNRYDGFNDIRGSGHFSGRITTSIVFAGAIAKQILKSQGILIGAHIKSLYDIEERDFVESDITQENIDKLHGMILPTLEDGIAQKMENAIMKAREEENSLGGIVEVMITGVKPGIGDPFFESIESEISRMIFSVPAVKGIEFGAGFGIAKMTGYEANDEMYFDENGNIKSYTNNNGGIVGGISTGMPISFKVAIKPTPSISKAQKTVNLETKKSDILEVKGRHDPVIVPRAIVVLECATAIVILDRFLEAKKYRL